MCRLAQAIELYILAQDQNRPHLLTQAFAEDATVEIAIATPDISFPPRLSGRDAIAETLIRHFGCTYENVYTFCLAAPPEADRTDFVCRWLVGMSEKESGALRIGSGRYSWFLAKHRVTALTIEIESMERLVAPSLDPVMAWLSSLPSPWCPPDIALRTAPPIAELAAALETLKADDEGLH